MNIQAVYSEWENLKDSNGERKQPLVIQFYFLEDSAEGQQTDLKSVAAGDEPTRVRFLYPPLYGI